ncbi:MAG TPA: GGDEF domain-containing phosphodiesterase, partial [Acidimicrobiales bacterium]|nr:GGDEF domain-containing phosphodiesterase [Acidimicrobiales bacterium]
LGGDEFGVLVLGEGDRAGALGLAQQLARTLQAVYRLGEVTVEVAASVGVVVAPADGTDPATLLQRADVAMYLSKAEGARAFAYDPAQDHHSPRRLALSAQLRRAIEAGDLDVAFQPVAALADGAIIGAEALVRWTHPRLGEVSAKEVVSTAERTGAIWPLTALVLTRALEWRAGWARRGRDLDVQVNVSARTLVDADLGAKVGELLARTGVPASALTLEITESSLVADVPRSGEILQRLRDVGVSVAIDDFGVGHASLAYLRRLPCDALKIDRSFVEGMTSDRSDQIIVSSTVVLAHSLGLRVVAEGVADVGAWARLRALGCDAAQGHFLAPALTPEAMEAWLWEWEARCEDARRWAGPGALRHPLPPRPVARPTPPTTGAPAHPSAGIVRSGGDLS